MTSKQFLVASLAGIVENVASVKLHGQYWRLNELDVFLPNTTGAAWADVGI